MLRKVRAWIADRVAAWVAVSPRRERVFVRAGRSADRHSYWLGTLYTFAIQQLCIRLRQKGDVYRDIPMGPVTLALDITDHSAIHEYFYGPAHRYEPELVDYLIEHLGPGDVCIDVGANIGFFSLIAARRVGPEGRVVAFEPHPEAREALTRLMRENDVAAIVDVEAYAVADEDGVAQFHLTDDSVLSTLNPEQSPLRADFTFDRSIQVDLTTLDAWLARHSSLEPRVSLVKIDVEGAEERAVAGMLRLLRAAPGLRVICETSAGSPADERLRRLGFSARVLDVRDGTFGNYAYERVETS
jgi:FkbM family methyltransferase